METFDLGIAWDNEADNEFVSDLNERALRVGLKPYLIHIYNFFSSLKDITEGELSFHCFFDRSSDDSSTFGGLADFLKKKDINFINHPDNVKNSTDKSKIHSMFISYGLSILKEKEKVIPVNLENKPAWFKVLYCFGEIIPLRWHPLTKEYNTLTLRQIYRLGLHEIWPITKKIKQACKLDFFSTDIVLKDKGKFLVVDYINDRPDMRKKSKFKDGLSDEIVDGVIDKIALFVKTKSYKSQRVAQK